MNKLLETILTTKRCHNSKGELEFLGWLHGYIKSLGYTHTSMAEGCTTVKVGKNKKKEATLFSCHIDTVHNSLESDGSRQPVVFDANFNHVFLGDKNITCLGADDGVGVYIMLRMMEAKVEGTYIFHRGEERGGIGARAMLSKHLNFLEQFDRSIAFDRPGTDEVIIMQGGQKCASVEFGTQLAGLLNVNGLKYSTSDRGIFTDNKVYRQVIPCNVNLGVGYSAQHSSQEYLDVGHVEELIEVCTTLPWETLAVARKIDLEEVAPPSRWAPRFPSPFKSDSFDDDDIPGFGSYKSWMSRPPAAQPKLKAVPAPRKEEPLDIVEELSLSSFDDIVLWLEADDTEPVEVAEAFSKLLMKLQVEQARTERLGILLGYDL